MVDASNFRCLSLSGVVFAGSVASDGITYRPHHIATLRLYACSPTDADEAGKSSERLYPHILLVDTRLRRSRVCPSISDQQRLLRFVLPRIIRYREGSERQQRFDYAKSDAGTPLSLRVWIAPVRGAEHGTDRDSHGNSSDCSEL